MRAPRPEGRDEEGFTLIELLISIVIFGFLGSAVMVAIILFFRTTNGTAARLSLSHDSQLLATYLVPDLDNVTNGTVSWTNSQPCPTSPTMITFQTLTLPYTDENGQGYEVDYSVNGTSLQRSYGPAGLPPSATTTITVVHNLRSAILPCFSSAGPPWTMTVSTDTSFSSAPYTFSVTGGGRVAPTPLSTPPQVRSVVTRASNNLGKIDHLVVTFDQPLRLDDAAGVSQWSLAGLVPGGATLSTSQPPQVSGRIVTLFLTGATVDTKLSPNFTVALSSAPDGIRNGANQAATSGSWSVKGGQVIDGIAPVLTSTPVTSSNTDGHGIDQVIVTFSEPLLDTNPSPLPSNRPWTLSGLPGVVLDPNAPPTVAGTMVTLHVVESVPANTSPGLQLSLSVDPGGVMDLAHNVSSFGTTPVTDRAAPVLVSMVSRDRNGDGKLDQVVVTFSEALDPRGNATLPWSLSGAPPGVSLSGVNVPGDNTAVLSFNEGTGIDTVAMGFQISLASNALGIKDLSGNPASFVATTVSDGMGPVLIGVSSTNGGGNANEMDTNDTLTLTFSEPLALTSLPPKPSLTFTPGANGTNDILAIPGVATINFGSQNPSNRSTVSFASDLTVTSNVVLITLRAKTGGGEATTAGTAVTVTPSVMVTDLAVPPNPAAGSLPLGATALF